MKLYKHRTYSVLNHYSKVLSYEYGSHIHTTASNNANHSSKMRDVTFKEKIENGPSLQEFLRNSQDMGVESEIQKEELVPYLNQDDIHGQHRKGKHIMYLYHSC